VVANLAPLVYCRVATYYYPIANLNLAGQRYAICDDAVATHNIVVSHVNVGHKEIAATYNGRSARSGTTAYSYTLANIVVVADYGCGLLANKLQILRKTRN
jgi:hypothetical protein